MTQLELFKCFEEFLKLELFKQEMQDMLSIKEIKNQLKLNKWELKKAIIDSNGNRVIELNTARLILLETLNEILETQLNKQKLARKAG
jgi:membrane protease subunit (stomatin/prohibitin family)